MTMVDELDDELGDWDEFFRAEYDIDEEDLTDEDCIDEDDA